MNAGPTGHIIVANTDIFATGVSVKHLYYAFFVNIGKSLITTMQSVGRMMRLANGKTESTIFDVSDSYKLNSKKWLIDSKLARYNSVGSYLTRHQKERLKIYAKEGHTLLKVKKIDIEQIKSKSNT